MRRRACDRLWEVGALRSGTLPVADVASFERHKSMCAHCTQAAADDLALDRVLADAPDRSPTDLELRRLRFRILADAALPAPSRRFRVSWAAAAFAALTLAALAVGWRARAMHVARESATAASREPFAGTVSATPGSAWGQERDAGTEHVRLDDGAVSVHVRKQGAGERFLVLLPDGELEVRGTTFDVVVRDSRTERVSVHEGLVALRVGGGERLLAAGESWPSASAPVVVAQSSVHDAAPEPPPRERPVGRAPPAALDAATKSRPTRTMAADGGALAAYSAAMDLYRAGAFEEAAEAFHQLGVVRASSLTNDLADDASFLEVIALARAGHADAASLAAERRMSRFPRSFHRREDALFVARGARDRGACAKAIRVLEDAGVNDSEGSAIRGACATKMAGGGREPED